MYCVRLTPYSWTQFLPQEQTQQIDTEVAVSPGDDVLVEVWVGDDRSESLSGLYGNFFIWNLSTNKATFHQTPVSPTVVPGAQVEWVVERITLFLPPSGIFEPSSYLADMANYGSLILDNAIARQANSPPRQGFVPYLSLGAQNITMTNGSDVLSQASPLTSDAMRFDWIAFT